MKRTLYTTLLCSALLTACGGGGGDDQTPLSSIDSSSSGVTDSSSSGVTDSSSSGVTDSSSSGVTDGAANTAPVASAGADLGVLVGSLATLDGSGSSDANGDSLTYSWAFVSRPTGSSASLSGANTVSPSFTPDVAGPYVVSLTVNDGKVSSAADTVTVNAAVGNAAPVANAGADQNVNVGASVELDGSGSSDANGDTLSYTWAFHSRPDGSEASLSGADTVNPSFTADVVGEYVLRLTVNDGTVDSAEDNVTVNAALGSTEPVGFGDAPPLQPPPEDGLRKIGGVSYCEGHRINSGNVGNLEVPAGQSCVLESGVTVSNITLGAGARLYAQGVDFNGNVNGQNGAALVVIEGSVIAGNVWLHAGGEITLRNNLISGSIQASTSTGLVYLSGNTQPTGNIQLSTNAGGVTVIGNQVGADLSCVDNDPEPTGGANVVAGDNLGQCAGL